MRRKVCVVTGSRAEYGLLYWLIKYIRESASLELQIIATNMHLSPEFGLTYKEIESDGFRIDKKVEMLLSSDTEVGISKSIGLGLIGFSDAYSDLKPNFIVILGDRFEVLAAAITALVFKIPLVHIAGGERTEGAFDEAIRHSLTKMSHLHFTATQEYRNRVIQLGENPERVFNVGAIALDNIRKVKLLAKDDFETTIGFKLNKKNLLITFHPVTLEKNATKQQFLELLKALDRLSDTNFIFTKPNSDTAGRIIIQMIDDYVNNHKNKAIAFTSMGRLRYLSAMQYVDAVVGNSSSGIVEAPSFKIGTINIGDRQRGRIKTQSIIDCEPREEAILQAFKKLHSYNYQKSLTIVTNPYGEGKASESILEVLTNYPLNNIIKKKFYDLDF